MQINTESSEHSISNKENNISFAILFQVLWKFAYFFLILYEERNNCINKIESHKILIILNESANNREYSLVILALSWFNEILPPRKKNYLFLTKTYQ